MRLISCHIDNFGKLHDYEHIFEDGKNIILNDNGSGKSTLAAFIRVMFYGFQGENKRNITDNERKRYRPWQSGPYGGEIVFSAGGKEYRMERHFGDKKSGTDEFMIYDNATKLKTDDFSSNIGEELFGIDMESFMRTVFIAQQDCGTEATSEINAKIGNVSDQTADMGNYDNIQASLKKEQDRLTPDRATGILNKMNLKIAELKETVKTKDQYESTLNAVSKALDEETAKRKEKENDLKKIQKELEKASAEKDLQTDAAKYAELCRQEKEASDDYKAARNAFSGDLPKKETAKEMLMLCDTLKIYQDKASESIPDGATDYEKIFNSGIPDKNTLNDIEKKVYRLNDLKLEQIEKDKKRQEEMARLRTCRSFQGIFAAVVILLSLSTLAFPYIGSVNGKIAIVFFDSVSAVILLALFIAESELKKKIRSDNDGEFESLSSEIRTFFLKYLLDTDELHPMNALFTLKKHSSIYEDILQKQDRKNEFAGKASDIEKKIKEYLLSTGFTGNGSFKEQLYIINEKLIEIEHLSEELKKCRERKENFESGKDIARLRNIDLNETASLEKLNGTFNELKKEIDDAIKLEHQYESQKNGLIETLENIRNDEAELAELSEESERLARKYRIIVKTNKYLEMAKLNFSQKYMSEIKASFERYHDMISDSKEKYELDANLNIRLKENGSLHDIDLMSEGYKDLVGLSRRIAMVDAMYDKEKPFLVLDDPFVNLDESKMKGAMKFIDHLSSKYQLIYFTCHESRT